MANIKINNLNPAGSELFNDSESYLDELTTEELNVIGGGTPAVAGIFVLKTIAGYLIGQGVRWFFRPINVH